MLKSFAGGRLFGDVWGTGVPRILALHGWQRTHRDFAGAFDGPGIDEVSALAPDLAGFGSTPPPSEAWGSRAYAESLVPLFEESDVLAGKVSVVGHSFGGRVAVQLATLLPDRIERLVLTGVPLLLRQGGSRRPAARYRIGRRLHHLGLVGDDRMEALRQRYGSPDYAAAHGVMREVFVRSVNERYEELLTLIACPVHLLWGADDTEVPVEVAERARPLFGSATLEVLPSVGHLLPTEAPGALRAAVAGVGDGRHAGDTGR